MSLEEPLTLAQQQHELRSLASKILSTSMPPPAPLSLPVRAAKTSYKVSKRTMAGIGFGLCVAKLVGWIFPPLAAPIDAVISLFF
jgi:hypothetical protein